MIFLCFFLSTEIKLFTFNPFKSEKIVIFNLTAKNVEIESQRMLTFNREKLWNLHRFPLKVHKYYLAFITMH